MVFLKKHSAGLKLMTVCFIALVIGAAVAAIAGYFRNFISEGILSHVNQIMLWIGWVVLISAFVGMALGILIHWLSMFAENNKE